MDFREMAAKAGYKPKLAWTVGEVSIITGIPVSTVRDDIRTGKLKASTIGERKKVVRAEWVEDWLGGDDAAPEGPTVAEALMEVAQQIDMLRRDLAAMAR